MHHNKHIQKMQPRIKPKPSNLQNTKYHASIGDRFQNYLGLHAHALFSSLGRLLKTPFTSMITIIVLAITISLATGFYVLLINVEQFADKLESSHYISLFLKEDINDADGLKLAEQIKKSVAVKTVKLITQKTALEEFKHFSGFGESLNVLDKNPLPTVIQVLPTNIFEDSIEVQQLLDALGRLDEVDLVQMDMRWVQRLQSIVDLAKRGVFLLSMILGLAVLFIMGNTIRLELENRRDEVLIAKLVGATYAFIQRPFLYTGFWFGCFAGISAWIIVSLILLGLQEPIEHLSLLYEGNFTVLFLSIPESLILLFVASILGVTGAWIVLHYQLRQMTLE